MEDCVFCKIIKKELQIPSDIYENESIFVFLSRDPVSKGHALIIPKKHFANIYEVDDETARALGIGLRQVSSAVKKAMNAHGINIHMNNDKAAGQEVFHAHFHIIPRYVGDGRMHWKAGDGYKKGEVEEIAKTIREEIK
jgi:histidine triad (HIT) family protein